MTSIKSEMPQGTLDMVILQVVAAGPIHGYALAHRIRLISRDLLQIQQGSLYPALHRLENRGFLTADWKASETGRDAKFYRLTLEGPRAAEVRDRQLGAPLKGDRADSSGSRWTCAVNWWQRLRNRDRLERELDAELGITLIVKSMTTSAWACPRRKPAAAHAWILAERIN